MMERETRAREDVWSILVERRVCIEVVDVLGNDPGGIGVILGAEDSR